MDYNSKQPILQEIPSKIDITQLPKHNNTKFQRAQEMNMIDVIYEDGQEVGFQIKDDPQHLIYEYDQEDGFYEPNGCYYSKDFEPLGWWVLDSKGGEHYFDIRGLLDGQSEDEDELQQNDEGIIQQKQS